MRQAAFIIYLCVLTVGPLLFGAVHTYSYTLMTLAVLAAFSLVLASCIRKEVRTGTHELRFPRPGLNVAFLLMFVFLVFQMIPLPGPLLQMIAPEAFRMGEASLPPSAPASAGAGAWFAPAPYAYPVRMSAIRLAVYGLFFLGFTRLLDSQRRIETTLTVLLGVGCFEALYGLIQAYSGTGAIWWYHGGVTRAAVQGTYINRNHFAGLMGMVVLCAASYAAGLSERPRGGHRPAAAKRSFRARLSRFLSGEQRYNKRVLVLFAGVVAGIGLVFSASRGGIVSTAAGLLCMSVFLLFREGQRRKGILFLALFSITAAYSLDIGVGHVIERFRFVDQDYEARARLARTTLDMFRDYPWTGVGVGNFQNAYPGYQSAEDRGAFARHAHNDWAQYVAEAGIVGITLMLVAVGWYVARLVRLWVRRRDPFAVCLGALPLAALAAMGVHEYSDFNLHIPANFLTLTAVMAVGYAALHLERHTRHELMNYRYVCLPLMYRGLAVLVLSAGLVLWAGYWSVRHFIAEAWCNTVTNITLNLDQDPSAEDIRKAAAWDPWNAAYWYKLGRRLKVEGRRPEAWSMEPGAQGSGVSVQVSGLGAASSKLKAESRRTPASGSQPSMPTPDTRHLTPDTRHLTPETRHLPVAAQRSIAALERAVRLNPFAAHYHLALGWAYAGLWQDPEDLAQRLPAADVCMARAGCFAGVMNPRLHVEMGKYWTFRSKSALPGDPIHVSSWQKACRHFRTALEIEAHGQRAESKTVKSMKKEIREYVWRFYPDEAYVRQAGADG